MMHALGRSGDVVGEDVEIARMSEGLEIERWKN